MTPSTFRTSNPQPGAATGPSTADTADVAYRSTGPAGDAATPPRPGFRRDIEGLRAVAVLLVVCWHAGVPLVSGGFVGVDVFFVISGYLITTLIVTEVNLTGRLSLPRFYARRAKRLLPSAALVLLAALVVTYLVLPPIRWRDTAWDVVSSALYVVNWRLAEQSVDYLAAEQAPSVVQHYWSLAVEEQFYLLWPVLLAATAWSIRRWRRALPSFGTMAFGAVVTVAVASFAWSVVLIRTEPDRAYFVTTTRIWELALGATLALWPYRRRLPGAVLSVLGWVGIAAIAGSALLLSTATPFPGVMALPATVGTALLLAAASANRYGPVAALGLAPMQFLGRISYTLYLWHWPVLVAFEARMDDSSPVTPALAVAVSVLLAYLTTRFVERPVWHARRLAARSRLALAVGVACTILPVTAGVAFRTLAGPAGPPEVTITADSGAGALTPGDPEDFDGVPVDRVQTIVPDPLRARDDVPTVYPEGCHANQTDEQPRACAYGAADSTTTVALIGDSHAAQWVPALRAIAERRGWRLLSYTKSACPYLDIAVAGEDKDRRPYLSCAAWNTSLRDELARKKPDLVVTSSFNYSAHRDGAVLTGAANNAALVESMRRTWRDLATLSTVVVLRDTPAPRRDIAECVSAHRESLTECAVSRTEALTGIGPLQLEASPGLAGVHLLDLTEAICPAATCAPVIGGVLVYRDTNHLTATYARTLATRLEEGLPPLPD